MVTATLSYCATTSLRSSVLTKEIVLLSRLHALHQHVGQSVHLCLLVSLGRHWATTIVDPSPTPASHSLSRWHLGARHGAILTRVHAWWFCSVLLGWGGGSAKCKHDVSMTVTVLCFHIHQFIIVLKVQTFFYVFSSSFFRGVCVIKKGLCLKKILMKNHNVCMLLMLATIKMKDWKMNMLDINSVNSFWTFTVASRAAKPLEAPPPPPHPHPPQPPQPFRLCQILGCCNVFNRYRRYNMCSAPMELI